MTLTDEQIEAIKTRAEAATPGPWKWWTSNSWNRLKRDDGDVTQNVAEPFVSRSDSHPDISISEEDMAFISHARTDIPALLSALEAEKKRADEAEDRAERFQDALQELQQWANAYPLNIFPEPNFSLAAKVLSDAGISLDAISASNMRHVLSRVEEITRGVLNEKETGNDAG